MSETRPVLGANLLSPGFPNVSRTPAPFLSIKQTVSVTVTWPWVNSGIPWIHFLASTSDIMSTEGNTSHVYVWCVSNTSKPPTPSHSSLMTTHNDPTTRLSVNIESFAPPPNWVKWVSGGCGYQKYGHRRWERWGRRGCVYQLWHSHFTLFLYILSPPRYPQSARTGHDVGFFHGMISTIECFDSSTTSVEGWKQRHKRLFHWTWRTATGGNKILYSIDMIQCLRGLPEKIFEWIDSLQDRKGLWQISRTCLSQEHNDSYDSSFKLVSLRLFCLAPTTPLSPVPHVRIFCLLIEIRGNHSWCYRNTQSHHGYRVPQIFSVSSKLSR